jgi:hypothetical protein
LGVTFMKDNKRQARSKLVAACVACLLSLLATQAIVSMREKSVTIDEIVYIVAGYYHLQTGDFQMNMTNPPLMKMLSALPLLALNLQLPTIEKKSENFDIIEQWKYARNFLYHNRVDADEILFLARLPIVAISILLGFYVFIWGRELYGENAGLFALFFYSFSPNILAHSRLATQDLGLAAFMFISSYYFWKYMSHPTARSLSLCGIFFGLAVLTKTTAVFLFPIFAIYALISIFRKNGLGTYEKFPFVRRMNQHKIGLRQSISLASAFFLIILLGIATLNLGYGFQGSFQSIDKACPHVNLYQKLPLTRFAPKALTDLLLELPLPAPSPFVELLRFQSNKVGEKENAYFAGNNYSDGLWYLTIIAFFLKTPLPILILLTASLAYMVRQRDRLEAEWLLVIFISAVIFIFSYLGFWNSGVRYVLPVYPFIHVLISRLFVSEFVRYRLISGALFTLSIWYLLGTSLIHPHYLAYFNELIGGPKNGYKYLVDSNLDWGQDLKGLKFYMERKGIERIKLGYFGSADASYYGIDYDYLPSVGLAPHRPDQHWWYEMNGNLKDQLEPQEGIIAVSATILASPGWMKPSFHSSYDWLRKHDPIDNVGYSILIYDLTKEPQVRS